MSKTAEAIPHPVSVRVLDVAGAIGGLIVTLPLWPVIALAVKVSSRGPVFHRGSRLGHGERLFEILKFRSMREGSSERAPITVTGDDRVTRVGRILRAAKLDELPQLINVLRGDMSLVGPRPEAPGYLDSYPPPLREIFRYRPGITSPASIEYRHEEELLAANGDDPERFYVEKVLPEKVALDLRYCQRRSVFSDLRILVRTARSMVRPGPRARS